MKSPIVICGATGNIGSRVVETLLAAGEPVRAVGRDRTRLGPLEAKGADPWSGDLGDAEFLAKAFAGTRGAFVLIPPGYDAPDYRGYQNRIADSLTSALKTDRVPRVVALSSVGAHLSRGTGPILGLHDMEGKLGGLQGAAVVSLRPGYFMENHLWSIPVIRANGISGSPTRSDVPIPMIATRDIAEEATRLLREESVTGHAVRYLLGPRDLTMTEAARILGEAIGKPDLQYVQFPEEDARGEMIGMGMSPSAADAMLEMERGFNAGAIVPTQKRSPENSTRTTLEEFARTVFAPAFETEA